MSEIEIKIEPPFPIESATARDILAAFAGDHSLHSMDGAEVKGKGFVLSCSCGQTVNVTEEDIKVLGWCPEEIKERLSIKKLGQIGRVK